MSIQCLTTTVRDHVDVMRTYELNFTRDLSHPNRCQWTCELWVIQRSRRMGAAPERECLGNITARNASLDHTIAEAARYMRSAFGVYGGEVEA